jgi:hypothetical protein
MRRLLLLNGNSVVLLMLKKNIWLKLLKVAVFVRLAACGEKIAAASADVNTAGEGF